MDTLIMKADSLTQDDFDYIADIILRGGLVVFPTETVYGIGANALNSEASERIYRVKGRPSDNPLIVHIASLDMLEDLVLKVSKDAEKLIKTFWPGPLTLIFKKNDRVPSTITAGLDTVAVRFPDDETALRLIRTANVPLGAPSANISGRPSSTRFAHVKEDLDAKVDVIIDGGKSIIGIESTVLDVSKRVPTLLRPGAITQKMIEDVLGKTIIDGSETPISEVPKSPGMKYTHYAPKGKVSLLYGDEESIIHYMREVASQKADAGFICAKHIAKQIHHQHVISVGDINNLQEVASNVFSALREMDAINAKEIYIHAFPDIEVGKATMNRLLKAAGYHQIHLKKGE